MSAVNTDDCETALWCGLIWHGVHSTEWANYGGTQMAHHRKQLPHKLSEQVWEICPPTFSMSSAEGWLHIGCPWTKGSLVGLLLHWCSPPPLMGLPLLLTAAVKNTYHCFDTLWAIKCVGSLQAAEMVDPARVWGPWQLPEVAGCRHQTWLSN